MQCRCGRVRGVKDGNTAPQKLLFVFTRPGGSGPGRAAASVWGLYLFGPHRRRRALDAAEKLNRIEQHHELRPAGPGVGGPPHNNVMLSGKVATTVLASLGEGQECALQSSECRVSGGRG